MSKYQDALIQELCEREPDETTDGGVYELYRLDVDDLAGVILYEDSEGETSGTFFNTEEELLEAWDDLQGEDPESEDEDEDED